MRDFILVFGFRRCLLWFRVIFVLVFQFLVGSSINNCKDKEIIGHSERVLSDSLSALNFAVYLTKTEYAFDKCVHVEQKKNCFLFSRNLWSYSPVNNIISWFRVKIGLKMHTCHVSERFWSKVKNCFLFQLLCLLNDYIASEGEGGCDSQVGNGCCLPYTVGV